ncbi:MAG: heparan-alpha-glucosaminide N-acetyltransferase domain-containing protein [Candidatus Neomarinimicrobiota bacterium]|jgi:hypothetical protein
MKRFASIDFLRGIAIFMMLILHMVMHTLNVDELMIDMSKVSFLEYILLIILPFSGGLAGFFLMVSAMGNAVSMEGELARNISPFEIGKRQVIGGFILLLFAMLVEGLIGYHGDLGNNIHLALQATSNPDLGPVKWVWDRALWRFNHFETIHTIAWCIILNGAIHSYLVSKEKYRDKNKLIKTYILLAIIVLVLTPLAWGLAKVIIPGFPVQLGDYTLSYPVIGVDSFWRFLLVFFMQPLAGFPEPVFPYLAASFIGTIFALFLTMPKEDRKVKSFTKAALTIGIVMYLIGLIGVIANIVQLIATKGLDSGLNTYMHIWDHRGWVPEILGTPFLGWYFQFMLLNGFGLLLIMSFIRLIELRGKAKNFGNKTRFIRRFGFVAFSNYTIQFMYYIAMFITIDKIFGNTYARHVGSWGETIITIILGLSIITLINLLWEKIRFAGSLEWMIKQTNYFLNPVRRKSLKEKGVKWYQAGLLNVQEGLYDAEWIDVVEPQEVDHSNKEESILARKLGQVGLVFPAYSIVGFIIARKARKLEGDSPENKKARVWTSFSLLVFIIGLVVFIFLSPSSFGITM